MRRCSLVSLIAAIWPGMAMTLLLVGCAHHCGYTDVCGRLTAIEGDGAQVAPGGQSLSVVRELCPESAVLAVRVEEEEITTGAVLQETYGREVSVAWRWYAPVVKPVTAATLVAPFWLAARCPHRHNGGVWSRWDYLRDVAAWYNPFSAIPCGAQEIAPAETRFDSRRVTAILSESMVPLPGRKVALAIDDRKRAEKTAGSDGVVAFDLAGILTADDALVDRKIRVFLADTPEAQPELSWTLSSALIEVITGQAEQ